ILFFGLGGFSLRKKIISLLANRPPRTKHSPEKLSGKEPLFYMGLPDKKGVWTNFDQGDTEKQKSTDIFQFRLRDESTAFFSIIENDEILELLKRGDNYTL